MSDNFGEGAEAIRGIVQGRERLTEAVRSIELQVKNIEPLAATSAEIKSHLNQLETTLTELKNAISAFESSNVKWMQTINNSLSEQNETYSQQLTQFKESLLSEIRAEMRDTREASRDRLDIGINSLGQTLDSMETRLIEEMPRSIFGKRGKSRKV